MKKLICYRVRNVKTGDIKIGEASSEKRAVRATGWHAGYCQTQQWRDKGGWGNTAEERRRRKKILKAWQQVLEI